MWMATERTKCWSVSASRRQNALGPDRPGTPPCAWIPIWLRDQLWGRVHVIEIDRPTDDIDHLALDRAAAAVGLALYSERHTAHVADHARGALISDIWQGRYGSAQEVLHRARGLGTELEGRVLVAVVVEPRDLGNEEGERQRLRAGVLRETREAIAGAGLNGLSAIVGDRVLAVVGSEAKKRDANAVDKAADLASQHIADHLGVDVVVGLSNDAAYDSLKRAMEEASEAAAFGVRTGTGASVHHFGELGVHHLLVRLSEGPELARFVESELGPLLEHDAAKSASPASRSIEPQTARRTESEASAGGRCALPAPGGPDGGTIYLTAADRWGNMVSLIHSVFSVYGSRATVAPYGFVLHNRGSAFSVDPKSPNVVAPHKRPFHTIIAGFVMKDGQPLMTFGNMGGSVQPETHAQHMVNLIDLGMNVQMTTDAARFTHNQNSNVLSLETNLFNLVGAALKAKGHEVRSVLGGAVGGYQGILFTRDPGLPEPIFDRRAATDDLPVNGVYRAGSDHRKDGQAVGW
jgi:hypothetical protein